MQSSLSFVQMPLTWRGWRFAAAVAAAVFALSMICSFLLPQWLGDKSWVLSPDYWQTISSAQWVSQGAAGTVYQANAFYTALPGYLLLLAPVVALGNHLGLVVGFPRPLPYPSMWILVGPFSFVTGATFILGVDYLCDSLNIGTARRRAILATSGPVVGVVTLVIGGHPEDLLALALSCFAFGFLLRGRPGPAAWMLAAAILMQTWAGLLLPTFVMAIPPGMRLRSAARAAGPPAALGALLLALDFKHASRELLKQPMMNLGQHLPWWQMASRMPVAVNGHVIQAVVGSTSRLGAVLVALAVGLLSLRARKPETLIAAAGLALAARGIFETEFWPYYLAPACILLAVYAAKSPSRTRWIVASLCALGLYVSAPESYLGISYSPWLALSLLLLASTGSLVIAGGNERLLATFISRSRQSSDTPGESAAEAT